MDFPLAIEEWDTSSEEKCGRVISPFVTQGTSQFLCASQVFPTYGLAVVVKKTTTGGNSSCGGNSTTFGFATHGGILTTPAIPTRGGIFFTTPAKTFVGKTCDLHRNWDVPFVTHGEIFFPHSWLRHSWGKKPDHTSPQKRYGTYHLKTQHTDL